MTEIAGYKDGRGGGIAVKRLREKWPMHRFDLLQHPQDPFRYAIRAILEDGRYAWVGTGKKLPGLWPSAELPGRESQ